MCKAYRTVSLNSALLLTGMLPLDLRVLEVASLYEAKRGVPQPQLGDREVERMAPAIEAPHPAERESLEVVNLENLEQVTQHSLGLDVRIFTDGSKIEGKVGAALSIWNGAAEARTLKLALPEYCTVYQAELLAINRATKMTLEYKASSFGILSDSMAALQTVKNPNCLHPLAVEARSNIKFASRQNKRLSLFWIKAHAGLEGNERADELAKDAAKNSKRRPDYDLCPVSFVKRSIRTATLEEWNNRYGSGETASVTKLFFPNATAAYKIVRKLETTNMTTQIMTGHGGFSEYLNRFKCKESPSCICDPVANETVPHILFECPVYAQERFHLENKLNIKLVPENVAEIMASKCRDTFMNYCVNIAGKVVKRNKTR